MIMLTLTIILLSLLHDAGPERAPEQLKTYLSLFLYLSIYLSLSISIYLSTYLSIYLSLSLSVCMYMYIYIYIYIYIYMTHMCIRSHFGSGASGTPAFRCDLFLLQSDPLIAMLQGKRKA